MSSGHNEEHNTMDEPFKKRKRSDASDEHDEYDAPNLVPEAALTRHAEYYFSSGDCVIRVENTLFNLHRFMLTREDSAFTTMFALPQDASTTSEGNDDQHPVVLAGDTADDFAHFVWILYATPFQLSQTSKLDRGMYVKRLFSIIQVASKYSFRESESWARDSLIESMSSSRVDILPEDERKQIYPQMLKYAVRNDVKKLKQLMDEYFHRQLRVSVKDTIETINMAENLDLQDLRRRAYFQMLKTNITRWDEFAEEGVCLSEKQKICLLRGYYDLVHRCEAMFASPPSFHHSRGCASHFIGAGCWEGWEAFWVRQLTKREFLAMSAYDVVGKLEFVSKRLKTEKYAKIEHMTGDCIANAADALKELISKEEEALASGFVY